MPTPKSMTLSDEEILKRAISKAVKNGWKQPYSANKFATYEFMPVKGFIFSHDFAKAFWGNGWHFNIGKRDGDPEKDTTCRKCGGSCPWYRQKPDEYDAVWIHCWQYHLQQIVLEENPVKYLSQFL